MFELPLTFDGEDKSSPLKNCIRNTYRHVRKWAKRTNTNAFRIYDRQLPHYQVAIDFYDGRFCVQYFARFKDVDEPPEDVFDEVNHCLESLFGARPEAVYWRTRIRRDKTEQYEKTGESKEFFTVFEYGVKFKVNLVDYLDTGLFLDHRETRRYVASQSKGKRLLNLFAYTCSFSVHAAVAGAAFTKSVDMSNTYTAWGRENFLLNGCSVQNNEIVREDCLKFLVDEVKAGQKYDVIVIDPPTLSRSKKMDQMFDIQEDYVFLIQGALRLLSSGGQIFFSTNSRQFVFDESHFEGCVILDVSSKTIPLDFYKKNIHRCWRITCGS